MLLTSDPTMSGDDDVAASADSDAIAGALISRIRSVFPHLPFSKAVLEERGGDHRILLLDDTYVFRFPRETTRSLDVEIAALGALRGRSGIAVPDYQFVDPAGRIGGYRLIAGDELTPRRFASLPMGAQHRVLAQAGNFLSVLHGLTAEDIVSPARWPKLPTAAEQAAFARAHHLPQIASIFPRLADLIGNFYDRCGNEVTRRQVVLHGDLVDDHILLTRDGLGLAGIIDFGDVALGDPVQDLLGFWAYGADAVERVIAAYGGDANQDLHEGSRRAFIRYRIDHFANLLASEGYEAAGRAVAELIDLLSLPAKPPAIQDSVQLSEHSKEMMMNDPSPGDRQPTAGSAASQLKDKPVADKAGEAVAAAKSTAGDVAAAASDKASSLVGQVKDQANAAVSGQKEGLADRIDELADAVHKSGGQFEGKQDWIAGAVERGASELGALATALRENDLSSLIGQVQTIARRQPALFIGASLAAGFAIARLGKLVVADVSRDDLPTLPEVGHGDK